MTRPKDHPFDDCGCPIITWLVDDFRHAPDCPGGELAIKREVYWMVMSYYRGVDTIQHGYGTRDNRHKLAEKIVDHVVNRLIALSN